MIVHFSSGLVFLQSKRSVVMFLKQKSVAAPCLRIWGAFEGQTHILGGKIEFLKRYCYLPMPLSQDFCSPPPGDSPPSQKGPIFLGIPPPGDEYPRNIASPAEGRMPQEYPPPPFRIFDPPIYAMWFIFK